MNDRLARARAAHHVAKRALLNAARHYGELCAGSTAMSWELDIAETRVMLEAEAFVLAQGDFAQEEFNAYCESVEDATDDDNEDDGNVRAHYG